MKTVMNMKEFEERMQGILKEDYDDFMQALRMPAKKALYLNPLKNDAYKILDKDFVTKHPLVKEGYYYDDRHYAPGKLAYFLAGLYYIQEPSAMLVAENLPLEKDDYVLDMCGAPGGKTCAVAAHLSHEGLMIANDIVPLRAKILSENVERFGLENTIVTNTDPMRFVGVLDGFFDKIILDAPCSGEGMFRKTDQAIETWSLEKVQECAQIQRHLIEAAYKLLRPGGQVIYSTCTYSLEENEDLIRYALAHFDFQLLPLAHSHGLQPGVNMAEAIRCYPHKYEGEGHFIALLQKGQEEDSPRVALMKPHIKKESQKIVADFYKENLNIPMPECLIENQGHIYAIKKHFPDLGKIRILRNGLYLGEVRKNYFVPSYSLALTLHKEDVKRSYDFKEDSPEIQAFIHGEALPSNGSKGYGVIFVDGYPLSFYKESNAIKNLFPKGLRR